MGIYLIYNYKKNYLTTTHLLTMGEKKIIIQQIQDDRTKRVTFKKRRIGLLKKAIELSKLTDALVELRVYHKDDRSLVDYFTNATDDFEDLHKDSKLVREYSRFHNQHYDLVTKIDEKVTKSGNGPPGVNKENEFKDMIDEFEDFINLKSMLSLAK